MRAVVLSSVIAVIGCGELRGSADYYDAFFVPRDVGGEAVDTRKSGPNDLQGDYYDDPLPETRVALRIDRRSAPTRPWIVFVSTDNEAKLTCANFQAVDWNRTMPGSAIIHVIELGRDAADVYPVEKASPPTPDRAAIGRATQTESDFRPEYATSGKVTITRWDATSAVGSFSATFPAFFPDDAPDAGSVRQEVDGIFDVTSCPVEW